MIFKSILKKLSSIKKFKKDPTFTVKTDTACISAFESWTMIFVLALMGFYGVLLIVKLVSKKDMQINQNVIRTNPQTNIEKTNISSEDGIELQITLSAYRHDFTEYTFEEQMEIFDLEIKNSKWGINQDGQGYQIHEVLQNSTCSEELKQIGEGSTQKSWGIDLKDIQLEGAIGINSNISMIYNDIMICKNNQKRLGGNTTLAYQAVLNTEVEVRIKSKFIDLSNNK